VFWAGSEETVDILQILNGFGRKIQFIKRREENEHHYNRSPKGKDNRPKINVLNLSILIIKTKGTGC
jgi:hypothetical protein